MPINPPPLKARPTTIADWIEVRALCSPDVPFRLHQLKRFWDRNRETEDSDPAGEERIEEDTDEEGVRGKDEDKFLDAICQELAERAEVLQDAYPFKFDDTGLRFRVRLPMSEAGYCYAFCLLLSHPKSGDLLNESWIPTINNRVRDLFQACSTLAAAGHVRGCAISFGWPRPHGNPPFLQHLADVYRRFGEGNPVAVIPAGASPATKDGEIDVIAWLPRRDGAGTTYLLGQVASGEDWEAKSIKGAAIDYFHNTWFNPKPPSPPTPSIFIPHAMLPQGKGNRRDRIKLETEYYGIIFDRLKLPHATLEGIALADDPASELYIERRNDIPEIVEWVEAQLAELRATGEAPL